VRRAFNDALAEKDGSLSIWLVLLNLKIQPSANQRELAEHVGVSEATLTTQLNSMDTNGLVTRRRDPENRRTHIVELTEAGEALFLRIRRAVAVFDTRQRTGLTDNEIDTLRSLLDRLAANASSPTSS
jgi:MarR family transcriptional regulator, transcriptional regulator for hemolysin